VPLTSRQAFTAQLLTLTPGDASEAEAIQALVALLTTHPQPFARDTLDPGHVTASALLLDATGEHLALVWHEKLQRLLEPGGHCEPSDETVLAAALRELEEETGARPDHVTLLHVHPVDVDVHTIPPHGHEGPHLHYDVRFAFRLTQPRELPLVTWVPLPDALRHDEVSRRRCARKLLALAETVT